MNLNKQVTILVIDDVETNIDSILHILDDYDLIPATSGEEAFSILESEPVDLILLDIVMLGMDGFDVCKRLKKIPNTKNIPVIFITANDDESSIKSAYQVGGLDYVTKPFKPEELRARVQAQITLHHQYQTLRDQNNELTRMETELIQSEERFRLAMDASRDGLWDWDIISGTVFYSKSWFQFLGLDMPNSDVDTWQERIHEDDKDQVLKSLQQHLQGETENWLQEYRLQKQNGSWIWVEGRGQVVQRDEGGQALRMVGTMNDINERKLNEEISKLKERLSQIKYSENVDTIMRTALDTAESLTGSEIGFYHFVDNNQDSVSLQIWSTRTMAEMCYAKSDDLHYPINEAGVWVDCIRERHAVIHNDYASLPHKKGLPEGHAELLRELTVPVFRGSKIVSVMGVGNKQMDYDQVDVQLVSEISDVTQDFVERKQIEKRIEYMAYNDTLTGLPNRTLLQDRIKQAIASSRRTGQLVGVAYIDLDGFKPVNDQYGHHVGDELLVGFSQRLTQELREGDTLARLGGDEFVLLLSGLTEIEDGERILNRILESVGKPFVISKNTIWISASIGVTFYPHDNEDPDILLRHADQSMYQAKQSGKSCLWMYNSIKKIKSRVNKKLIKEVENALDYGQFDLYFQPRVDLYSGEVISAEALLRWNHPEKGVILPGEFLPYIESNELQQKINEWVISKTLDYHMQWREMGLMLPVSINISPRLISKHGFMEYLKEILSNYPEDVAHQVELEILETGSIDQPELVAISMQQCAALGIRFSLDDFGTGYSSLTSFHYLPIDILKIDQNFVKGMLDNESDLDIVEEVIRLSFGLKRPVVAEGVESVEIGLMLMQLGCQYAQGFDIARPMQAKMIPDWINVWKQTDSWMKMLKEIKALPSQYDLSVSIFSHNRWVKQISDNVRGQSVSDKLSQLSENHCQFDRWYRGIGLMRYGNNPSYPFIPTLHNKVHEIARRLVSLLDEGNSEQTLQVLEELQNASMKLSELLSSFHTNSHNKQNEPG